MTKGTSTSRKSKKALVSPSSRDSISGWLDVLTSMLSLPESKRLQVRDELEDHLRSRVDDLLITGTPEPEAIRKAVAELGETAELAKLITHAHTHSNSRRRIMNTALIMAAVAGLSIGGLSLNNTGTVPAQTVQSDTAIASDQEKTVELSIPEVSMLDAVREIAGAFDREFFVSPGSREMVHASFQFHIVNGFTGSYTLDGALSMLESVFVGNLIEHKMVVDDDSVMLMTVDEYQRSLIETRVIPSPSWLMDHELFDFAGSLKNLIEVKHDLTHSSIEVVGGTIVVAAPPDIQVEVQKLVAELNVVIQKQMEIRASEAQDAQEERDRRRDLNRSKVVKEVTAECIEIDHRLEKNKGMLKEILGGIEVLHQRIEQQTASPHPDSPSLETLNDFLRARNSQVERLRFVISEDETRRAYLTNKRLDAEYAHLFDGID